MKKSILLWIGLLLFLQGCMYAVRYDGTYKGKVVDAETGHPIKDAVVLGTWHTVTPTVAGGISHYYDARETETNNNGEFSIPGMGLRIMSNLEPMHFVIFKAGYEHIGSTPWESLKVDIQLSKKIKWEGSIPIIPLKILTMQERRNRLGSYYVVGVPDDKQKLLMQEIEKENKEIGK